MLDFLDHRAEPPKSLTMFGDMSMGSLISIVPKLLPYLFSTPQKSCQRIKDVTFETTEEFRELGTIASGGTILAEEVFTTEERPLTRTGFALYARLFLLRKGGQRLHLVDISVQYEFGSDYL